MLPTLRGKANQSQCDKGLILPFYYNAIFNYCQMIGGKTMNIQKQKSGTYRCKVYIGKDENGKKKYKSFTHENEYECMRLAIEFKTKRDRPSCKKPLKEAIDSYIESKSSILSPSTIRGYRIMQKSAYDSILKMPLDELDNITLQRWANENAIKYSAKSINNQFGLLTAVMKQNGLTVPKIDLKPKTKTVYVIPDMEQIKTIIKIVKGKNIEIPILLALLLGLRQSEIKGLKWENYNPDKKRLSISGAVVPDENNIYVYKKENKSYASNRTLDVPDYLCNILNQNQKGKKDSDYISEMLPASILKSFHKLCKENKLPEFKIHALRHANASIMLLNGVSDKYAMERLGQSTPSMIKNVYQHIFNDEQKKISEKLNNTFNELIG